MVDNVFNDEAHRALARTILKSACAARKIEVAEVEFGPFQRRLSNCSTKMARSYLSRHGNRTYSSHAQNSHIELGN